ncbi:unnamed protein product, partial [Colletotrichum noveboracense]
GSNVASMSVTPDFAGLGAHDAAASAFSSWGNIFNTLWSSGGSHGWPRDEDLAKDPKRLASICGPINARMIKEMNYSGAPVLKAEAVESLLEYMYRRSVEFGVPLDTPISSKGFRLGYSLGLLAHPRHPTVVQGFVGLFTWLVVQYDDLVGQAEGAMVEEAMAFHKRFFSGQRQKHNLLEGLATLLREAYDHWDPVLANMLQLSALKFLTCNLLERHEGFLSFEVTRAGEKFPDFLRDMSGINVAYAVFCYPKAMYPDVSQWIEAIPDMARIIDIANDVFSFYKEELSGDTRNYIHNRALTTGRPLLQIVEETKEETMSCARRVATILKGRGTYEASWNECVAGYIAMHTTNARYRFAEMGLGEEHPLAPFEHRIGELFDRMKTEIR